MEKFGQRCVGDASFFKGIIFYPPTHPSIDGCLVLEDKKIVELEKDLIQWKDLSDNHLNNAIKQEQRAITAESELQKTKDELNKVRTIIKRVVDLNLHVMPCAFTGDSFKDSQKNCKKVCNGDHIGGLDTDHILWSQCLSYNLNIALNEVSLILFGKSLWEVFDKNELP